jgi:hypothetical protein
MGAAHALEAEMSRINATNILICPKGVEIDEEELELDDEELDEEYTDEDYDDEEYDDYDEEYDEDYELNDYDQEDDNEKLEHISGVLKSIAIDLDIPVIALSQLNRACEEDGGRVPTSSDLRGSGALEQDATAVWILHTDRDVVKTWTGPGATPPLALTANQTPAEMKGVSPVRFIIAKNQNRQAGADIWFPFLFYKKYCLFMLADNDADAITTTIGSGAAAKTTFDYSPKYARVTHDWRCDPFERVLYDHGALVGYDLMSDRFLLGEES